MSIEEKLDKVNVELDALRSEYKKVGDRITRKVKQQEKLLLELNKNNLDDPEWLILNPTLPGAHEGMLRLFKKHYGGEYNGPHPSGYIHDGNYKPVQKNFNFWLNTYGKHDRRNELKQNCDHFLQNFLQYLKPVIEIGSRWDNRFPQVKVVPFQFCSEDSGLDCLGYEPTEGVWYHYTLVYGRADTQRRFDNWDAAFEFAYAMSNQSSREEDDDELY
jgi:hypothetical protein